MSITFTDDYLGIGITTPVMAIDIHDSEYYATKAVITNTSTAANAYSNWGSINNTGAGTVMGQTGSNYTSIPLLANRGFLYSWAGAGMAINNADVNPIIFGINNTEVGRWDSNGTLKLSSVTPSTLVDGQMWYDGTNLKIHLGGVTKTVTVS